MKTRHRLGLILLPLLMLGLCASPAAAVPGDLDYNFDADGTADGINRWAPSGRVTQGLDFAAQPDGKLVVVGAEGASNSSILNGVIARFNEDGTLDTSFSDDATPGYYINEGNSYSTAYLGKVAVNPDTGEIVAVGQYWGSIQVFYFDSEGELTNSVNLGRLAYDSSWAGIADLELTSDGLVTLVLGENYRDSNWVLQNRTEVLRLDSEGELDTSFSGDGIKTLMPDGFGCDGPSSADLTDDGSLIVAGRNCFNSGQTSWELTLSKLDSNGDLDESFGQDGIAHDPDNAWRVAVAAAPNGKLFLSGMAFSDDVDYGLQRYSSDGSPDEDWGDDGLVKTDLDNHSDDRPQSIIALPHGDVVVSGYTTIGSQSPDFALAIYKDNGDLDNRFSSDGKAVVDLGSSWTAANGWRVAKAPHNQLYLGGAAGGAWSSQIAISRFDSLDPEFAYDHITGRVGDALDPVEPAVKGDLDGWTFAEDPGEPLPDGLTVDEDTGEISGTPTEEAGDPVDSRFYESQIIATHGSHEVDATVSSTIVPADPEQQFRPILLLDSAEKWRPLNVENFLGEQVDNAPAHTLCGPCNGTEAYGFGITSSDDLHGLDASDSMAEEDLPHIDINGSEAADYHSPDEACLANDLYDCDTGSAAALYWHHTQHEDLDFYDYWAFYRYNDSPGRGLGGAIDDHEGDWEGVVVAGSNPSNNGSGPTGFKWAGFDAHGTTWNYLRGVLYCDWQEEAGSCGEESGGGGQRVMAYVARGSHATYPRPCAASECHQTDDSGNGENSENPYDTSGSYYENSFDGLAPWGANQDPIALKSLPSADPNGWDQDTGAWTDWPGLWGVDGAVSGPHSPGASTPDRERFWEPWLSEENCSERWTSDETTDCSSLASIRASATPEFDPASDPGDACRPWQGAFVAISICDPDAVQTGSRQAFRTDQDLKIHGAGPDRDIAATEAVTQVVGSPLQNGQTIKLKGRLPQDAVVQVQTMDTSHKSVEQTEFQALEPTRSLRVEVHHGQPQLWDSSGNPVMPGLENAHGVS